MSEKELNIETTFKQTYDDAIRAHLMNNYRNITFYLNLLSGFILCMVIATFIIGLQKILVYGYRLQYIVPIIVACTLAIIYLTYPLFDMYRVYVAWIISLKLQKDSKWQLSNSGITITTANKTINYDWSQLFRIIETRRCFFLKVNTEEYYYLPIKSLDEQQIKEIKSFLRTTIDKKKLRIKK